MILDLPTKTRTFFATRLRLRKLQGAHSGHRVPGTDREIPGVAVLVKPKVACRGDYTSSLTNFVSSTSLCTSSFFDLRVYGVPWLR